MNPNAGALPELPGPKDTQAAEPQIEIERVDDTPEADRGRSAPTPETYQAVDDEAADAGYGQQVQGRIKQLRHVYHEERRQKEAAQREREALASYVQSVLAENDKLRGIAASGERVVLDSVTGKAEAQVASAKDALRRAMASGDDDEVIKAQEEVARAVSAHERYKSMRPSMPQQPPPQQQQAVPVPPPMYPQQPPQQPQMRDERTDAWVAKNPWWTQPGRVNDNARMHLLALDKQLMANGILPGGPTADAYWATVDQQLQEVFPSLVGSGGGNANGSGQPLSNGQTRPRPVTAASGTAKPGSPVKVKLTDSMLRMANRLGVPPEKYALELLKIERAQGKG